MTTNFPSPRGAIVFLLLGLNSIFWCAPFFPLALLKLFPHPGWRRRCTLLLRRLGEGWIAGANAVTGGLIRPTVWDVEAADGLDRRRSYLLLANHQSWVDILVLLRVFDRRIPFPVFFVKRELLWFPLIGFAMWALDFPFVERYPREVLERRPELRGRDLATARRACERYRQTAVTLVNFPEGTRFTPAKHRGQGSPYRHLLTPHPGGTAVVLATLGAQLSSLLDATIAYPAGRPAFRDFLSGRVPRVIVRVQKREVPDRFVGRDFAVDTEFRSRFRAWLEGVWREKDAELSRLLRKSPTSE